jgi:hypothetical protein
MRAIEEKSENLSPDPTVYIPWDPTPRIPHILEINDG